MRSETFKLERNQTVDNEKRKIEREKENVFNGGFDYFNEVNLISFVWFCLASEKTEKSAYERKTLSYLPSLCSLHLIWCTVWILWARCTMKSFFGTLSSDWMTRIGSELLWNLLKYFLYIFQSVKTFNYL